jgi:DNA-binding transcriptional regulator YdaS (Cro superfamily)
MQLSEWLKRANLSQKGFARVLGVSPACVNRFIKGNREPSIDMIDQIERATNGDVRYDDWKKQIVRKQSGESNGAA